MSTASGIPAAHRRWRYAVLAVLVFGSLLWLMTLEPIAQDRGYHDFADGRPLAGVANFWNVASNAAFLVVGALGLRHCLRADTGVARRAWTVFFIGVSLVSAGSAWYHWNPGDGALVWDRLPMTIGFMGLLVALLSEHLDARIDAWLLLPAIIVGIASVLYWAASGDLRPYIWVQFMPLALVVATVALFRSRYSHNWMLLLALAMYGLAKVAEDHDEALYDYSHALLSGHTIKHLIAALACYTLLVMLQKRKVTK